MGEILRAIYDRQLDGEVTTLEEGLAVARTLDQLRICDLRLMDCIGALRHRTIAD